MRPKENTRVRARRRYRQNEAALALAAIVFLVLGVRLVEPCAEWLGREHAPWAWIICLSPLVASLGAGAWFLARLAARDPALHCEQCRRSLAEHALYMRLTCACPHCGALQAE